MAPRAVSQVGNSKKKMKGTLIMKRASIIATMAWLMAVAATLQSCDNDDDYYYYHEYNHPTAIVTVKPNADNSSFYLQLDDTATLIPMNMRVSPFGRKEVRALVNYVPAYGPAGMEGSPVAVSWIDSVLTKPTATDLAAGNGAAYGDDPVEIVDSWETVAEDGYLTLRFRTRWAAGVTHRINLVHRADADTTYLLQLYHDAGADPDKGQVADDIVAFRLGEEFNRPDTAITLTLKWNSYSGPKTHTFKYRPRKD